MLARYVLLTVSVLACSRPASKAASEADAGVNKAMDREARERAGLPPEPIAKKTWDDPGPASGELPVGHRDGDKPARPAEAAPLIKLEQLTGDPAVLELVARLKSSISDEVKTREGFEKLKAKGSYETLIKALRVDVANVRSQAAVILRRMKVHTPELTAELVKILLSDPDADVRGMVARNLVFYLEKDTVPALAEALEKDEAEAVRTHSAWALGDLDDPRGIDALIKATEDPETNTRLRAVNSLQHVKSKKAIPAIIKRLKDPNVMVRGRARETLTSLYGKDLGAEPDPWSAEPAPVEK